jgi:trimeric autotransporter adhesin
VRKNKLQSVLSIFAVLMMAACGGGGSKSAPTPQPSNNAVPVVTSLSPTSVIAGAGATNVVINGSGFISSSSVQWGSAAHASTLLSGSQIQVSLSTSEVASAGTSNVTVTNPAPGGGTSSAVTFSVNNPAPVVSLISPAAIQVGSSSTTITVTGTGFVSNSVVNVNGAARVTTFKSSTQLTAALLAADFQATGNPAVTVTNPTPGGGTSTASNGLSITNPIPVISALSPSSATAGSAAKVVTLTGSGFVPGSVVKLNGVTRVSTYVSSTQMTVSLSAADLASTVAYQFTVVNPGPGGGSSYGVNFAVTSAPAAINFSTMNPDTVPAGYGDFELFITGSGFTPNTVATWNGSPRPTDTWGASYGFLYVEISAADVQNPGSAQVVLTDTVTGATSAPQSITILPMAVSGVQPSSIYAGGPDTTLTVWGGGFASSAIVQWNGAPLATTFVNATQLTAIVPASYLAAVGDADVTVENPDLTVSNAVQVQVLSNPVPSVNNLSQTSAPIGSGPLQLTMLGSGFTTSSVVKMNGTPISTTLTNNNQLQFTLTAQQLELFGNFSFTVTNPAPGGGTSAPISFSTYLALKTNDLVYSSWSGLIYASTPSTAGSLGNRIVGIDPSTGNILSSVFVGSEPKKMALSSDGKTIWVGLDGAAAVRKVDLVTMTAGLQFGLGGGPGIYNPPATAVDLAVMPGSSDTVAVSSTNSFSSLTGIRIFDSGIARTNGYTASSLPIAFDPSGTKLYAYDSGLLTLTIDATGVASYSRASSGYGYYGGAIRYDNGRIYTSVGTIYDASNSSLLGTFYNGSSPATGWPAPDSANGKAFVLSQYYGTTGTIFSFDTTNFTSGQTLSFAGLDTQTYPTSLVRWGQNGLAFRTSTQIYVTQSNVVKDLTSTPADLKIVLGGATTASTGSVVTYTATVTNNGPNAAHNVVLINSLPDNSTPGTVVTPQGTCVAAATTRCNLGTIASGASVQVTFAGTLLTAGSASDSASVSAVEPDSNIADNQSTANTVVSGADYNAPPTITAVSPAFVKAAGASFDITVTGAGFSSSSVIRWNGTSLATTFVDSGTLTANVDSAKIASLGYSWVDVTSPTPGGGSTAALPVTFYAALGVDVTKMLYEPFSRKIFATVPSSATQLTGNSIVTIDPAAASIGTPVNVGSQPTALALSDDGRYVFIILNGSNSITRFNIAANATDLTFPLGMDNYGGQLSARGLAVAPGNPNLLAVDFGSGSGDGLVDISGNTATRRANLSGAYTGSGITFADSTHVYTYDSDTTGAEFYRWNVTATGLSQIDATTLNGMGGFLGTLQYAQGKVFGVSGGVVNPSTTPPSMLGQFSFFNATGLAADPWNGEVFFLGCSTTYYCSSPNANEIQAFDVATYLPINAIPLSFQGQLDTLVRWGSDGLAFRTSADFWSAGSNRVIILRGPVVTPQLGVAHATGTVTSVSPNSATAGSVSGFYVTVTGSGFVQGATARWNGSDRTTYFVDSSHLSVAIPATDIQSAGTASLTVKNPGATSATSSVTFTIN